MIKLMRNAAHDYPWLLKSIMGILAVAFVITTMLLYVYKRSLSLTVLALVCALMPVVWLLGLLPLLGYGIDTNIRQINTVVYNADGRRESRELLDRLRGAGAGGDRCSLPGQPGGAGAARTGGTRSHAEAWRGPCAVRRFGVCAALCEW